MMLKRIAAAAACALLLVSSACAQVIGSGHVMGNGTASPATSTDTPLIQIMSQSGSGIGSGVATILGIASGGVGSVLTLGATAVNGNCAQFNSLGRIVPAGGACTTGAGGGTVTAGTAGQIAFYNASGNTIVGEPNSVATGRTWAKNFGVVCDGTTDDTTNLQAAWNAAAAANQDLYFGGIGTGVCKITQLAAPQPTSGETGNRSALVGAGMGTTVLKSSTPCALDWAPTGFGTNSDINTRNRDFSIIGTNISSAICLLGVTQITFQNVFIGNFAIGVFAQDALRISFIDCIWAGFTAEAVEATFGTQTHPNSWTFINPRVSFAQAEGFIFISPTQLNIVGGDWENNCIGASGSCSSVYIDGNPVDGTAGLNLSGGYFSANGGGADITIDNVSGTQNGVHTINGAEFDRNSATQFAAHNIFLANNGTGFTTLNIRGNGFQGFSPYVPSASNLYIAESNASSNNWLVSSGGNWFQSSIETPAGSFWAETGWVQYSPTLTCSSGTLTSSTVTGAFKRIAQKTIAIRVAPAIITLGSCAGSLLVSLPFTSSGVGVGAVRNTSTNAAGTISTASTSTATILNYDGTLGVTSGNTLWGELQYETTQ
jgi:hypothetical protein